MIVQKAFYKRVVLMTEVQKRAVLVKLVHTDLYLTTLSTIYSYKNFLLLVS